MVKAPKVNRKRAARAETELTLIDVLQVARQAAEAKKAEHILVLNVSEQANFADYFLICSAQTELHAQAIADHTVSELARYDIIPDGLAGYQHGDWILIDYGLLMVHVFLPRTREFYRLEELWAAAQEVELKD